MIDGARRFAVRWLLEPTEQEKEYTYEYSLRLVTYHTEPITVMRRETDYRYEGSTNNYEYDIYTLPSDFIIPQVTIYRIEKGTNIKEKIGKVEYFMASYIRTDYSFYDSKSGESVSKVQYTPYLISLCSVNTQPSNSYMIRKWEKKVTDNITNKLLNRRENIETLPIYPYTSEFLNFTDDTVLSYSGTYIYIKPISTPAWNGSLHTITEDEEGTITETIDENYYTQAADSGVILSFRPGMSTSSGLKYANYYEYQDLFNVASDSYDIPNYLVKCSEGLDYETFVNLCSLTSNFKNKTTITFEHD